MSSRDAVTQREMAPYRECSCGVYGQRLEVGHVCTTGAGVPAGDLAAIRALAYEMPRAWHDERTERPTVELPTLGAAQEREAVVRDLPPEAR